MKAMKFYTEINGEKYLMRYKYQNLSFPLFGFEVFSFSLFGLYRKCIKLKNCGSLYPKECVGWSKEQFREHATNTLKAHFNLFLDKDTDKSIENFNRICNQMGRIDGNHE